MPTPTPDPAATRPGRPSPAEDRGPALPLPPSSGGGRAAVPDWVHLLPPGSSTTIDGRTFKAGDLAALVARSLRMAPKGGLPLDYDHAIDHTAKHGGEAPAAGWITELATRPDGLWGRVEWTPRGRASVAAREYRFVSPVLMHAPDGAVGAVLRASLCNNPALRQLVSLNTAGTPMDLEQMLATLRELLALPEDADAPAVVQSVRDLVTAKNTVDPARFVSIELFQQAVAEANKANLGVARNVAERVVDEAIRDRKLMGWMREWGVSLCMANAPAFEGFLSGVGQQVSTFVAKLEQPAFPGHPWNAAPDAKPQGISHEIAKNLGLTAEDIAKYGT